MEQLQSEMKSQEHQLEDIDGASRKITVSLLLNNIPIVQCFGCSHSGILHSGLYVWCTYYDGGGGGEIHVPVRGTPAPPPPPPTTTKTSSICKAETFDSYSKKF